MNKTTDDYVNQRDTIPSRFEKYISRYDFSSPELQDSIQRNSEVIQTRPLISLATAQTPANPLAFDIQGRGLVIHFVTSSDGYDPVLNTGLDSFNPTTTPAIVWCRFNSRDGSPENGIALKHGRGFIGTFNKFFLQWPAQPGISVRVTVFKWDGMPWTNGDLSL